MTMQYRNLILYIALSIAFTAHAGEGEYSISKIPSDLLKKAHVVKRMEEIRFEVMNIGEAVLHRKYAVTILDENGVEEGSFTEFYDKLHEIKNIEGSLYDANGKELKRLKNKQIIDFSGVDDELASDNRMKHHNFYYKVYPYTVEYEVEIRFKGTMFFPEWLPREKENYAVMQSSISIITPPGYTIRYKAINYSGAPVETSEKDKRVLTWQVTNLPAIEDEYASPAWYQVNTSVLFAPSEFELERYKGNMSSWKDLGKFQAALNEGRDVLPDKIKQAVHSIIDNIKDPKEKVAKLYEYMQQNTRYISVQLGIGGWQPFDAKYVAARSYGDCKALSNYMYSLLKEAGIRSNVALIHAGRGDSRISADFPSAAFNHMILSVPFPNDTMWLECTSQTMPAGYLGEFTCDRYALLIDADGGTLVRTPKYGLKENLQLRKVNASLDDEATLKIHVVSQYEGLQQDLYHALIHGLSREKVKEFLHEELDFATYDVNDFNYLEKKNSLPAVEETLDVVVSNYATLTGKRLFISPNVMTRTSRKWQADEERKFDLDLGYDFNDIDSVELTIPAGFASESMPADIELNSKFGKYNSSVKLVGNKIFYYRNYQHFGGTFPAKDYAELVKFYEAVYKADRNKIVLLKTDAMLKGF